MTPIRVGPGPDLRPAQLAALAAAEAVRARPGAGVLGLVGCGHGKTLIAQLVPVVLGARAPLLVVPAALVAQTARDVEQWGATYRLARPRVLTYEAIGAVSGRRRLLALDPPPDMIVLDEAHLAASTSSARWVRLVEYLRRYPETRVVALSGTLTWRSVDQIAHLAYAALRSASPIPLGAVPSLSATCDLGGTAAPEDWRVTEVLLGPGPRTRESARARLHAALLRAPGVVHAAGVAADASLTIARRDLPEVPGAARALADIAQAWALPDGTELVDAIEVHRARRSLAWGWWSRWADGARTDPRWAAWWAVRSAWADVVRRTVPWRAETPGVTLELARTGALGHAAEETAAAWVAVRADAPPREVAWLDGARDGAAAALRAAGDVAPDGLLWAVSRAVLEIAPAAGYHVAGAGSAPPRRGVRTVASWRVHGKGWNGQDFARVAIVETPESGAEWEQLLARHHRPGQTEDVEVAIASPGGAAWGGIAGAIAAAEYARTVLGAEQRLTLATWPDGRPQFDGAREK